MVRFLQTLHDQNFRPTDEDKLLLKDVKKKGFPYRLVWNPVPVKIGVFAWEAVWDKVLTLDQLKRR